MFSEWSFNILYYINEKFEVLENSRVKFFSIFKSWEFSKWDFSNFSRILKSQFDADVYQFLIFLFFSFFNSHSNRFLIMAFNNVIKSSNLLK